MFRSIVEAVFHHAARRPEALCLADDADRATYREYADKVRRYAGFLAGEGVAAGDRVVVEASQSVNYLALELALQLLGAIFVPVERNCAPEKVAAFARRVDAAAVISARAEGCDAPLCRTLAEVEAGAASATPYEAAALPERTAVSEILFSTGTTGKEKGIVLTHDNDVALAENVIRGVGMAPDNVEMILSPLNHSHGLRRYYANMVNGSAAVLLGSAMNLRKFMANMEEYGVNAIDMVPAALSAVLKLSKGRLADYRAQLRYIQFGAAPMPDADRAEICRLLPETRLYNFYGSTESGCIAIYDFNRPDAKRRCVGRPTCNADIFIVDDDRRPIASSATHAGLLASAGRMNMVGYWQDAEETARVLAEGVVYSSDEAYVDGDGDIILLGRRGDVINVGGSKVSPEEIENAARQHPDVADCGVVPMDDPFKGSVPRLFVQMRAGRAFDAAALRAFLAERLEPYKVPASIEQIAALPRSFNGKLLRKELKGL